MKLLARPLAACLFMAFALSCAHTREPAVSLVSGAQQIRVVEHISEEDKAMLKDVGFIKCSQCMTLKTLTTNQEACRNDLRNQAQALGGTQVLVVEGYDAVTDPSHHWISNCVAAKAVVYKPAK